MKIRSVGAELFDADRRTERQTDRHDEAKSRFSQFCQCASTAHNNFTGRRERSQQDATNPYRTNVENRVSS